MKKTIFLSNLSTLFLLGYYAVTRGLDPIIGGALCISIVSNMLTALCIIRNNW